jgi:hypothetical protein
MQNTHADPDTLTHAKPHTITNPHDHTIAHSKPDANSHSNALPAKGLQRPQLAVRNRL